MEILYCLDKGGGIREFSGDIISHNLEWGYETRTGKLNGKLIFKPNWVKRGKQGRTIQQQAQFKLESAYKEKYDEGYKGLLQLKEKIVTLPIDAQIQWDIGANIQSLYNLIGLKFNSNKDWFLLPQLAEKWRDYKDKVEYPVLVQCKLNGVRCLAFWNSKINDVSLMSRGGDYYNVPHILNMLRPVLSENRTTILDGELYKHNVPLQTISGACRLEQLPLLDTKQSFLEYWVYDIPDLVNNQKTRESNKIDFFSKYFTDVDTKIFELGSTVCQNEAQVLEFHDKAIEEGYEGCIVRNLNSKYQFGFRDKSILKVKNYIDEEFEIVGCEADNTNERQIGESFVFVLENNNGNKQEFKARPTGTLKQKLYWYNNMNDILGKKATIRYQERSTDGLPIQGHVRAKESTILMENIREYGE